MEKISTRYLQVGETGQQRFSETVLLMKRSDKIGCVCSGQLRWVSGRRRLFINSRDVQTGVKFLRAQLLSRRFVPRVDTVRVVRLVRGGKSARGLPRYRQPQLSWLPTLGAFSSVGHRSDRGRELRLHQAERHRREAGRERQRVQQQRRG